MIAHLGPERADNRLMVKGEQKERNDHSWKSDRVYSLEKLRLRLTFRRHHIVIGKSFQKEANKKIELASFPRLHRGHVRLHFERQNGKFRRGKDCAIAVSPRAFRGFPPGKTTPREL